MRRFALVLFASTALAAPAPKPRVTWADWVGEYTGTLAWTSCTAAGATKTTIAIDAIDGALSVELARAADWLPRLSLVEEDATLAGVQADLKVVLARPKANAIDVAIDLESGCRARGRLVRAGNGAACDRLVAWARVEARCTKLHGPPLEPKLGNKLERCEARATALETELVDAGCAPDPDPLIGVRGMACVSLATTADRVMQCAAISADMRARFASFARGHVTGAQHAPDAASLAEAERHCASANQVIRRILAEHRCL